ncbi:MAG: hypothetical protein HOI95_10890 [Chromatiales bacterium]|jgi:hypothetical protein|nr:hypothetical protein [Chromatiales bacterium]
MTTSERSDGHKLNDDQWFALKALADVIVPPSMEHGVPGAGDDAVCKNIITDAAARLPKLIRALELLEQMAKDEHGLAFAALADAEREGTALHFRGAHAGAARLVETLVTQCYYRDDRVMLSLGMEPRPPHPAGYSVDSGDWSLLDQVRRRSPFHRSTS